MTDSKATSLSHDIDDLDEHTIDVFDEPTIDGSETSATAQTYQNAVIRLLSLAESYSSASEAAATVLLAIESNGQIKIDVTKLTALDRVNYQAFKVVMHCYQYKRWCPSDVIKNGRDVFSKLRKKWAHCE